MIAFLGTGLLGSNFTKALLKRGEQVQVWNRTASKAKALEADGAKACDTPADAVRGIKKIHITLKDDAVVDEVLAQASSGLEPGAIIIDHTTTSAEGAAKRTEDWKKKGYTYIHAPVFMGPQNALESTGYMLISGDQDIVSQLEPDLSKMTGRLIYLGRENNKAAGIKLIGNLFLIAMTGGISDILSLAKSLGLKHEDVAGLFDIWNPGAMLPGRLKRMMTGDFSQPSWELSMARKDAGLMMAAAEKANQPLMVVPSVAKVMDKWIEKGHGNDDWMVIGKDSL